MVRTSNRVILIITIVSVVVVAVSALPAVAQTPGGQASGSPASNLPIVLAPLLVISFAIQQLLEFIDPFVDWIVDQVKGSKDHKVVKSWLTSGFALVVGLVLAWVTGLGVLSLLQAGSAGNTQIVNRVLDVAITGLFLSGGTDGVNSLLKLLGYS